MIGIFRALLLPTTVLFETQIKRKTMSKDRTLAQV